MAEEKLYGPIRLPVVKSLHIDSFTGVGINAADYFNTNAVIGE
ncbi:unnamed protein product, partial [marine sediment metagenome]